MAYFPMMVNLEGKDVLVAGGGEEGLKKIQILSLFGARITLIACDALPEAAELSEYLYNRAFEPDDIRTRDFALIVSATNDRKVNAEISSLAQAENIPVNIVDDAELCTFIFPAIIKDKDLVCAVSSAGKSPYVVQYVKKLIQKCLPEGIGDINDRMGEYRVKVKKEISDPGERRKALKSRLEELLF